ncbi:MAG: hypothetical protein QJR14_09925 [Bacillota bacterium]|nr:hypothetical protein [Bacillota bacterium]
MNHSYSAWGWILQAVSGALLLFFLGEHIVINHFSGLLTRAEVIGHLRNPWWWVVESGFLVTVTFHALAGIRAVLFDLGLDAGWRRRVTLGAWLLGALMVGYGLWLTWGLVAQGGA